MNISLAHRAGFVSLALLLATTPLFAFAFSHPDVAAPTCPNLYRNLSFGSRGSDVTGLQTFLITQGDLAAGNSTGYFGRMTEAAVQKFQVKHGIASSGAAATTGYGVVGPRTRAKITAGCNAISYSQSTYYAQGNYDQSPISKLKIDNRVSSSHVSVTEQVVAAATECPRDMYTALFGDGNAAYGYPYLDRPSSFTTTMGGTSGGAMISQNEWPCSVYLTNDYTAVGTYTIKLYKGTYADTVAGRASFIGSATIQVTDVSNAWDEYSFAVESKNLNVSATMPLRASWCDYPYALTWGDGTVGVSDSKPGTQNSGDAGCLGHTRLMFDHQFATPGTYTITADVGLTRGSFSGNVYTKTITLPSTTVAHPSCTVTTEKLQHPPNARWFYVNWKSKGATFVEFVPDATGKLQLPSGKQLLNHFQAVQAPAPGTYSVQLKAGTAYSDAYCSATVTF